MHLARNFTLLARFAANRPLRLMPDDRMQSLVRCRAVRRVGPCGLRWLLCGFVMLGSAQQASAADFGDNFLRGSTVIEAPSCCNRWDGVYFGGQVGQAWSGTDYGNSTRSLVAFLLRNTTIENEMHVQLDDARQGRHRRHQLRRIRGLADTVGRRGGRHRSQLQSHQPQHLIQRFHVPLVYDQRRLYQQRAG